MTGPHRDRARRSTARTALRLFIGATTIGLGLGLIAALFRAYGGYDLDLGKILRGSLAVLYPWAALVPVIGWLVERFPLFERPRAGILVHLVAMVAIALTGHLALSLCLWLFQVASSPRPATVATFNAGLVAYVALATGLQLRSERGRRRESQRALESMHGQLTAARLEALTNRLQPHFLFNTLNAISSFVSSDPERAEDMLEELASLFRATLAQPAGALVPLSAEIDLVRSYLRIQEARLGDRLDAVLSIADDVARALVPPLLLQPLIENAIEHGVARCETGGVVELAARREDDELVIRLTNPLPPSSRGTAAGHGVGLENVRLRLDTRYGGAASIRLRRDDTAGRVDCVLRLPWQEGARA